MGVVATSVKITMIANKVVYCLLCLIVTLAEMQVSMTNAKEDTSKIV